MWNVSMQPQHTEVSVLGLGEMGGALACALLRAGRRVTVWNRSSGRAAPLRELGAVVATDPAAAIAASPVVLVCVSDYAATGLILAAPGAPDALAGRCLIQLSTGTPREARALDARIRAAGAEYLDGAIMAWPRQIGSDAAAIAVAGPEQAWQRHADLVRTLAGASWHLGEPVGHAAALFAATLSYLAGHWIGLCHGALVCEAEGLPPAALGDLLAGLAPVLGEDARHVTGVIARDAFDRPESTLATAAADIAKLVEHAADAGIGDALPRFAAGVFHRAVEAGHGAEEHAAIVKVMRAPAAA